MTNATLRPVRLMAGIAAAWAAVALLWAGQGQIVSLIRGTPQPWWPSLGYSAAIFSIWALLTPALLAFVSLVERRVASPWRRGLLYLAGLPVTVGLHVIGFALIYWPLYNEGGRIATRRAMAERMFVPNLDTDTLFYAILLALVLFARRRGFSAETSANRPQAPGGAPEPLRIRDKGRLRLVPLAEVDWIGAAGDYAEINAGGRTYLLERSLVALERSLPSADFARIHRGAIVRLDRIAEVRSVGRGDAIVRLAGGRELRLSRRYRDNLAALIEPASPA